MMSRISPQLGDLGKDAGVVDEDVELAESFDGARDSGLGLLFVGNIGDA